jgi:hypothetical protein
MLAMMTQAGALPSVGDEAPRGKDTALDDRAARQIYLDMIGLTRGDPFALPVNEQELEFFSPAVPSDGRQPSFFDLVIPPPLSGLPHMSVDESLKLLREPRTNLIYGVPGSGKTTLRWALDAFLRQKPDRTLSVTYCSFPDQFAADNQWQAIAQELAVDLFIQIVEQIESSARPTPDQIASLRTQIVVGDLTRLIDRILSELPSSSLWGLGDYWPAVNRSTVRRVSSSPALMELLQRSRPSDDYMLMPRTGREALIIGLEAARLWGFDRVLVLVDGVDTPDHDERSMQALIQPLIDALPTWEAHQMIFKFFLPRELQGPLAPMLQRVASRLTSPPLESIIGPWDDASLRRLLAQRFRAGGSRRVSFEAGPELAGRLDDLLIKSAQGLPRRLLQLVSRLIDQHAVRDPHNRSFSLGDWKRMRSQWPANDPPVPMLPPDL